MLWGLCPICTRALSGLRASEGENEGPRIGYHQNVPNPDAESSLLMMLLEFNRTTNSVRWNLTHWLQGSEIFSTANIALYRTLVGGGKYEYVGNGNEGTIILLNDNFIKESYVILNMI
jgi:hypothetical protein